MYARYACLVYNAVSCLIFDMRFGVAQSLHVGRFSVELEQYGLNAREAHAIYALQTNAHTRVASTVDSGMSCDRHGWHDGLSEWILQFSTKIAPARYSLDRPGVERDVRWQWPPRATKSIRVTDAMRRIAYILRVSSTAWPVGEPWWKSHLRCTIQRNRFPLQIILARTLCTRTSATFVERYVNKNGWPLIAIASFVAIERERERERGMKVSRNFQNKFQDTFLAREIPRRLSFGYRWNFIVSEKATSDVAYGGLRRGSEKTRSRQWRLLLMWPARRATLRLVVAPETMAHIRQNEMTLALSWCRHLSAIFDFNCSYKIPRLMAPRYWIRPCSL